MVPRLILTVFLVGSLAATVTICAGWNPPPQWRWFEIILPLLASLSALSALARRLPLQNSAAIGGLILALSAGILACRASSQVPFGPIRYGENAGLMLFSKVPLALPFWWVAILVSSRETARLILRPWRHSRNHGFHVVSLAAVLAVVVDLNWEPFTVHVRNQWCWDESGGALCWYGTPGLIFLGCFISALVLLGFTTPWFIVKRPFHLAPGFEPALIWCVLNLHFIAGNAAARLWPAVIVGGALAAATGLLGWRGIRQSAGS